MSSEESGDHMYLSFKSLQTFAVLHHCSKMLDDAVVANGAEDV